MAKSPFAAKRSETYKYPSPLDCTEIDGEQLLEEMINARKGLIDPEVEGEDIWITVRIPRSKGDSDAVAELTQGLTFLNAEGASIKQAIRAGNRGVFELLTEAWSFDREANGAAFDDLDVWASDWVSACLADAMRQGQKRGYAKKTETSSDSSTEPENSGSKSPAPVSLAQDSE